MNRPHTPQFLAVVADARTRVTECTVADVARKKAAGEPFTLIDVREESEYAAGHAPGAVHIGKGVIERDIETAVPDPAAPVVLYCGGGFRSILATDMIQKMGYTNVLSMEGGWTGWQAAGQPTEKG